MPNTDFELKMDDFVRYNIGVYRWIYYLDVTDNKWKMAYGDLNANTKYKLNIRARNNGSETYVKNVQIRVVNKYPTRIKFFKDDSFSTEVKRLDSPIWPKVLKPRTSEVPGETTPVHQVPFMVKPGPDVYAGIASVGVYAEIVPQGHRWLTVKRHLD